jgi:SAM-dependent methyltransferase
MDQSKKVSSEIINLMDIASIKNEATNLLNLYKCDSLSTFNIENIQKLDVYYYNIFMNTVYNMINASHGPIHYNHPSIIGVNIKSKNWKLSYYEKLIEYITNKICEYSKVTELFELNENIQLYSCLTLTIHGHKFLNKIKKYINPTKLHNTKSYLIDLAVSKGTFYTFLFWIQFFKEDIFKESDMEQSIFVKTIKNSDDRIFKWCIEKIKENNSLLLQKTWIIKNLISQVLQSAIPSKYKLKRLKFLSQNCNLVPYFEYMLELYPPIEIISELLKYYYKIPMTFTMIEYLVRISQGINSVDIGMDTLYSKLVTDTEKLYFIIHCILKCENGFNILSENNITELNINVNDIMKYFDFIISDLNYIITNPHDWQNQTNFTLEKIYEFKDINGTKIFKAILNLFGKYNLFHKFSYYKIRTKTYLDKDLNNFTIPVATLTKFLPFSAPNLVKVNKILSFLRILAKRKTKTKIMNFKIKYIPVIQELMAKKGSTYWQNQKQKFTNLPPRHLLPYEFNIYNKFLLREKADGILINNLTNNIYPVCSDLINNQVKAEFIEELDLYFVFDIDISDHSVIERYEYLRKLHPYTNITKLQTVTDTKELITLIEKERDIFNKFINDTKEHQIKWYPKIAFLIDNPTSNFKKEIINDMIINEESRLAKFINNNGIYKCDGIIISPLSDNAQRDIKIKPRSMMTIDLLFDGSNWIDKEKNKYNSIISLTSKPKLNKIYRCYPIENKDQYPVENKYQPREIRFDKKHPNNFDIINMIQCIYKFDWSKEIEKNNIYYQIINKQLDKIYIRELECQTKIFNDRIDLISPQPNKMWLDLGCGKGKLINVIKKFNPKKYVGMDIDESVLLKNINQIDENDWIKLNHCNLKENWFTDSKWYNIEKLKFDYVVLNYSIMHLFDSTEFWKCLKSICKSDTKILFNIVSDKIKTEKFVLKEAYMKYENDQVKYLFPWVHKTELTEKFISRKDVENKMLEYGFIIDKIIKEDHNLSSYYDWYFIENKN